MNMKRLRAFTLIELMVTLAVLGIMLAIGIPSFTEMLKNNRITTSANQFATACSMARIEAVRRGTGMVIVANVGGGASNEWGKGFSVSVWDDSNEDGVVDAGEIAATPLRQFSTFDDEVTFDAAGGATQISFFSTGAYNAAAAESFTLCDSRTGETGRRFTLSLTGKLDLDREFGCL